MAVSTDAILCYGFRLHDAEVDEDLTGLRNTKGNIDFEDLLARMSGLEPPDTLCDEERRESDSEYNQRWGAYEKRKRQLENGSAIRLVYHNTLKAPMLILAAADSIDTAKRGYPTELGQAVTVPPEWRESLREFCEKAGIPFQEPQFILCSLWA